MKAELDNGGVVGSIPDVGVAFDTKAGFPEVAGDAAAVDRARSLNCLDDETPDPTVVVVVGASTNSSFCPPLRPS